jgi:radical SAM protein with 4Fe4S-binding SPASM domain
VLKICIVTFDWGKNDAIEKFRNFKKKKSLSWAVVEITNFCNFNCVWCYAKSSPNGQHMSIERAKKLIHILANTGLKQITFSGGEPLLYPHLKEVIKFAKNRGLIVHINTNGYLLTKKLTKELKELGLTQVQINIDSLNPEMHDRIRGKSGSFKRAVQALKNAQDVGLMCVSQTVLTKANEDEIIDIFKFARSIGIQRCRVWDMTPEGHAKEKIDMRPTDFIGTLKKIYEFALETGAKNIESYDPLFLPEQRKNLTVSGTHCAAITGMFFTISSEGDVYPCAVERKPLYNIFEIKDNGNELDKFHKSKLKKYIQSFKNASICKKCKSFKKCEGGCLARRDVSSNKDYWCQHPII